MSWQYPYYYRRLDVDAATFEPVGHVTTVWSEPFEDYGTCKRYATRLMKDDPDPAPPGCTHACDVQGGRWDALHRFALVEGRAREVKTMFPGRD